MLQTTEKDERKLREEYNKLQEKYDYLLGNEGDESLSIELWPPYFLQVFAGLGSLLTWFTLRNRNKNNLDSLVCIITAFMGVFVGTTFYVKSASYSWVAFLYIRARWTQFMYMFFVLFVLRIFLWRFVLCKMRQQRCFKTSIILSIFFLVHIIFFSTSQRWLVNIMSIGAVYLIFWTFYNELSSKKGILLLNLRKKYFFPEDTFFLVIVLSVLTDLLYLYPWDRRILIRVMAYFFLFLIFLFVLKLHIPNNATLIDGRANTSLFAPRNCLPNCFFLYIFESAWAGWEMSYGSELESVLLSQISMITLLFLIILRKENT